jgi:hypothetical protein
MKMGKREEALLRLDELAHQLEWGFIQEGGDLTFRRRDAQGYHYTSERNFAAVRAQGLGRHPGLIEAHEVPYWFVMPFLAPTTAAKLLARWEAHPGRLRRPVAGTAWCADRPGESPRTHQEPTRRVVLPRTEHGGLDRWRQRPLHSV